MVNLISVTDFNVNEMIGDSYEQNSSVNNQIKATVELHNNQTIVSQQQFDKWIMNLYKRVSS